MTDLGTLALHFIADVTSLEQSLKDAQKKALATAQSIEKAMGGIGVSFKIDDSALQTYKRGLDNQKPLSYKVSIDLETAAYENAKRKFESASIKPKVDASEVDALERRINKLSGPNPYSGYTYSGSTQESSPRQGTNDQQSPSISPISIDGKQLGDEISKEVGKAIKSNSGGGMFKSLFTGAFENLGGKLTGGISQGLTGSLEKSLSPFIGSFDLLGETVGKNTSRMVGNVISAIPFGKMTEVASSIQIGDKKLDRKVKGLLSSIQGALLDGIDKDQIAIEQRVLTAKEEQSQGARKQIATVQLGKEYQATLQTRGVTAAQKEVKQGDLKQYEDTLKTLEQEIKDIAELKFSPTNLSNPFQGGGEGETEQEVVDVEKLKEIEARKQQIIGLAEEIAANEDTRDLTEAEAAKLLELETEYAELEALEEIVKTSRKNVKKEKLVDVEKLREIETKKQEVINLAESIAANEDTRELTDREKEQLLQLEAQYAELESLEESVKSSGSKSSGGGNSAARNAALEGVREHFAETRAAMGKQVELLKQQQDADLERLGLLDSIYKPTPEQAGEREELRKKTKSTGVKIDNAQQGIDEVDKTEKIFFSSSPEEQERYVRKNPQLNKKITEKLKPVFASAVASIQAQIEQLELKEQEVLDAIPAAMSKAISGGGEEEVAALEAELEAVRSQIQELTGQLSQGEKREGFAKVSEQVAHYFDAEIGRLKRDIELITASKKSLEIKRSEILKRQAEGSATPDDEIELAFTDTKLADLSKQVAQPKAQIAQLQTSKNAFLTGDSNQQQQVINDNPQIDTFLKEKVNAKAKQIAELEKLIEKTKREIQETDGKQAELERLLNLLNPGIETPVEVARNSASTAREKLDKGEDAIAPKIKENQDTVKRIQEAIAKREERKQKWQQTLAEFVAESNDEGAEKAKLAIKEEEDGIKKLQEGSKFYEDQIEELENIRTQTQKAIEAQVPKEEAKIVQKTVGGDLGKIQQGVVKGSAETTKNRIEELKKKLLDFDYKTKQEGEAIYQEIIFLDKQLERQAEQAIEFLEETQKSKGGALPKHGISSNPTAPTKPVGSKSSDSPLPIAYRDIIKEVSAASGINIQQQDIPNLKAFSEKELAAFRQQGIKANAAYEQGSNTLYLTPDQLQSLISDNLSPKLVESVIHELTHGLQADFGRLAPDQISGKRQLLRPTLDEYKSLPGLAEHIESSTSNAPQGLEDVVRAKEQDAYIFAARNHQKAFESVSRNAAIRQAEQVAGAGGGKLSYQLKKLEADQTSSLSGLIQGAKYDVSTAGEKLEAKFGNIRQVLEPYIEKLRNIDALPTSDIEHLTKVVQGLLQKVNDSAANYAHQVHDELIQQAKADLQQQLQGGFTSKEELQSIAKEYGVGVSGTKKQIARRIVDNVDINQLSTRVPTLSEQQRQIQSTVSTLAPELIQGHQEKIPDLLREGIQSSREALKQFKSGAAAENPLPELEQQYQLVMELLEHSLQEDVRNYLMGARAQIGKLKKDAATASFGEKSENSVSPLGVEDVDLSQFQLAGSFANPLEAARAKLRQVIESARMGHSVNQSNKANAKAAEAMSHVYEASLRQTDVEINKAMSAFDEYEAKAFQEAQSYIEARMEEYEQAILQADTNATEQVQLENAYLRHGNVKELQQNARRLSEQELKGNVVNPAPIQTPEAIKQIAGKKPEGDTLNLIAEAIGDMFSGIAARVKKQADILQMHIPSLMTDIATSAVIAEQSGDEDEARRLKGYHKELGNNQSRIQELSQKTNLSPEDTKGLQSLNMATQDIFKSLNVAVPEVNGFFDAFTKGGGILGNVVGMLKNAVTGFLAFQGVMFLQNFMAQLAGSTMDAAVAMESLERRIGFVSGSAAEGAKNLAFVRETARSLGTDVKASLEGFAGLSSSTRETSLEGEPTRQIFKGVSQASTVYDLNGEQQGRVFAAVQQMASKGKVSAEELRQQLGESLPGAFQAAARAMGMTTEQLDKMMSTGQLMSDTFLPKFAQQLSAETASGVAGAANSSVSALIGFNNALFETEAALGKAFLPARNAVLGVLGNMLNLVAKNADTLMQVVQFLGIALGILLAKNLTSVIASIAKIPGVAAAAQAAMTMLGKSIQWQGNKDKATGIIESIGSSVEGFKNAPLASSKQAIAALSESVSSLASGAINSAKDKIGGFLSGIRGIGSSASGVGQSFISAAGGIKAFGMSAATNGLAGLMTLAGGIRAIMAALAPLLIQFLLFQAVVGIFKMVSAAMSDTSGDTRDFANTATKGLENYKNALAEARGETKQFAADLKNTRSETLLDVAGFGFLFPKQIKDDANWFDKARFNVGKFVTDGIEGTQKTFGLQTWEDKKFDDQQSAIGDARSASNQIISEQYTMLGANGKGAAELAKMKEIDRELEAINTKRRASASLNPEDKATLRSLDEQQKTLLKQRELVSKPIGILQAASQSNIDSLKKQIEKYEQLASEPGAHQGEYRETLAGLKNDLEAAQTAQEKFNRSVGEAVNAFTLLQRNVQKVQDELADTADRQALLSNRTKTQATLNSITNTTTPGQAQKQASDQVVGDLVDKLLRTTRAYTTTKALTNTSEADVVRQSYGVTDSTGQAELKTLAEKAKSSGDTKAEYFLNQFSAQKKSELDISQLQSELANAEKTAKEQLDQSNKAIADYYRSVEKQTADLAITAQESERKIAGQQMKNKVLDAMAAFQDNIFTQLADSITNILDELDKPIQEQLNAQKQIQSNNFGYQDQLRQVNQLRRNSPDFQGNEQDLGLVLPNGTNLNQQKIPVSIDIQNLDSSQLDALNQKIIGVTQPAVDSVNTSTQQWQGGINSSGQELSNTLNPAIDAAKISSDALGATFTNQSQLINISAGSMAGFASSTDGATTSSENLTSSISAQNPAIEQNTGSMGNFGGATDIAKTSSDNVGKSLSTHAPTINSATKAQSAHGATMQQNIGIAGQITNIFKDWWGYLDGLIRRTIDWFKTMANNMPILGQVGGALANAANGLTGGAGTIMQAVGGAIQNFTGNGKTINTGAYQIVDSNDSHDIHGYNDITRHHIKRGHEGDRNYGVEGGKEEEIRKTSDGQILVKKDMVLEKNGSDHNVSIPAPVTGFVKALHDAWNTVQIYSDPEMKHLQAQVLHMARADVKTGDKVQYGQALGIQGDTGSKGAIHAHIELGIERWSKFVQDLKSGNFTDGSVATSNVQQATEKAGGFASGLAAAAARIASTQSTSNVGAGGNGSGMRQTSSVGNNYVSELNGAAVPKAAIALLKSVEGYSSKAYTTSDDPVPTIGWGSIWNRGDSKTKVRMGQTVDKAQATQWMVNEVGSNIGDIKKYLPNFDSLADNIKAVVTSYAYQWGTSVLPKREWFNTLKSGNVQLAAQQLRHADKYSNRRNKEADVLSGKVDPYSLKYDDLESRKEVQVEERASGGMSLGGGSPAQMQAAIEPANIPIPQVWTPEGYGGGSSAQTALNQAANQAGANLVKQNQLAQSQANANADTAAAQAFKQLKGEEEKLRQAQLQQKQTTIRNQRFARDEDLSAQVQTPEIQQQRAKNQINDKFDDKITEQDELVRKLKDTVSAGEALQKLLPEFAGRKDALIAKLSSPEYQKQNPGMDVGKLITRIQQVDLGQLVSEIKSGVEQSKKDLASATQLRSQMEAHRKKALDFEEAENARKNKLKQDELKDADIQNQAKLLEGKIAATKQFQQTHPFDTSQGDPIEMQKTLDLLNQELNIRKQIRDLEQKKHDDPANSKAYDNQLAQLKEQDKQLRTNIESRTKLEEDQRKADQQKALLENKQFAVQMANDFASARSQATDLYIKNHPYDFSKGDPLRSKYQSDIASTQIEGESKLNDFDEKTRLGKFIGQSPEDVAKLRQGIVDLNNLKLDNLKAEFDQAFKEREQQRLDFLLNQKQQVEQSGLDVLSAQQSNLSGKGLTTQANAIGKKVAIAQQGMSFEKQIRELEKLRETGQVTGEQFLTMKANAEQLNDVKLQGIQDQFSPWTQVVQGMQGSFKTFFSDVLTGSKSLKDAFKGLVDSILSNLANMAAEWLSNKLFGEIFGLGKNGKSGSKWMAGSLAGDSGSSGKGQESPLNNIVPFTNPANASGFATGISIGTTPMQPMFVQDVSQSPLGGIADGGLLGGGEKKGTGLPFVDFFTGGQFGGLDSPMPVNMVSANQDIFGSLVNGLGGLLGGGGSGGGLGGIIGSVMGAVGGGGGGMGGIGSLISPLMSIFGLADGGYPQDGAETKIPNYADGKLNKGIEEAMRREKSQSGGREPMLAVLNKDEIVLSAEQSKRFEAIGGARILNFADGGKVSGGSFAQSVADKSSSSSSVSVNVPVNIQGGNDGSIDERRLKQILDSKIRQTIIEEQRNGGSLRKR